MVEIESDNLMLIQWRSGMLAWMSLLEGSSDAIALKSAKRTMNVLCRFGLRARTLANVTN